MWHLLSVPVHLHDFICFNSNNKKKIEFFFRAFSKIMGTIFGCKWHFPSSDLKYDIVHDKKDRVPRKKKLIKKNQGVAGRWSKLIMRLHPGLCMNILNK